MKSDEAELGEDRATGTDSSGAEGDWSTRQRVLSLILARGASTAQELAGQVGLSSAAVRRHLSYLQAVGKVEVSQRYQRGRRGRGRPAKCFVITDEGRAEFHQAYDDLALEAIDQLLEAVGPVAIDQIARRWLSSVTDSFDELRTAHPQQSSAELLAQAFSRQGHVASLLPVASGVQLCQHHCPVERVAQAHPELCRVETQVISGLLGSHVQRLATIAHGDGVCTTHIPHPISTSGEAERP